MTMTTKACLALTAILMVAGFAGMTSANTGTDVTTGGQNDWCEDTNDDNFLYPGGVTPVTGFEGVYCDGTGSGMLDNAAEGDSIATVLKLTADPLLVVACDNDQNADGGAADTTCVGGALSTTDNVYNRGELGIDYPKPTGVKFDIQAGASLNINVQVCTMFLADDSFGPCYDDLDSAPFGTCYTGVAAALDLIVAVNADIGPDIDLTLEVVTEAYIYWSPPTNPTGCATLANSDRTVYFDWDYEAFGTTATTNAVTEAVAADALVLTPTGDGLTCLAEFKATATWTGNGGGGGVWLLSQNQQDVGFAVEATGAPQTVTGEDFGFVPEGTIANVITYAYAIGAAGDIDVGTPDTCVAGLPTLPLECFDGDDNDGDMDGIDYPADPQCAANPLGNEDGTLPEPLQGLADLLAEIIQFIIDLLTMNPPACFDQMPNDTPDDGLNDFPDDPECDTPWDDSEQV